MPVMMDISIDPRQMRDLTQLLREVPMGVEKALNRAVNKVAVAARTRVLRMITRAIYIKQRDLRQRNVRLRKASFSKLYAVLSIIGSRIPLIRFGARQTKAGVTYRIRRSGGRKRIDSAFIQKMTSGHEGVFIRTGAPRLGRRLASRTNKRMGRTKGMAGMTRPRLPISERYGPSVPEVVRNAREYAGGTFERMMGARLGKEVDTQVILILKRHGREVGLVPI